MRFSDELGERIPQANAPVSSPEPPSAPVSGKAAPFQKGAPEEIFAGDKAEVMKKAIPINELLRQYGAETVSISKELPEKLETKYVFLLPSERYADFERGIRGRNVKILKVSELPASAALLQKKAERHLGAGVYEMKSLEAPSTPSPVTAGVTVAAGGAAVNEVQQLEKKGVEAAPQVANGVSLSRKVDLAAARPAKTDRSRALVSREPEMEKAKDIVRKPSSLANTPEPYIYEGEKKSAKAGRERRQTLEKGGVTVTTSTLSLGYYTPAAKQTTAGAMKVKTSYYYIEMLVGQAFTYDPTNGTITTGDVSRSKQ